MRLVVAIVHDEDAAAAVDALTEARFGVTRLATSGGFLRKGNATLLVGTDASRVAEVVRRLTRVCRTREELHVPSAGEGLPSGMLLAPFEVQVGGATIFVLDVREVVRV
ncbi:MAG TPA: cyclic-di-AMP receptor [Chloroflexota bacterium]|nr:cyclic-di-AMP receptor [Chloroflexota bacterium]